MKILIVNYRYFISGGPERYLFNLQRQLEYLNHKVMIFSIDYIKNFPSIYNRYFVSPIGERNQVYFNQHGKTLRVVIKTLSRLFYSLEVEKAVNRIVDDQHPQIAYVLHYLRKLSPSLLVALKNKDIPIVVRLSDYAMLCPQAHCLRDGKPCKLCVKGKLWYSIRYKCVKNSLAASLINAIATWYHNKKKYFELIDIFICTNKFMYKMMIEAGYSREKLVCIPTFTDTNLFSPVFKNNNPEYILYCGRINHQKGVHILIRSYKLLQEKGYSLINLVIAGVGDDEYLQKCHDLVKINNLSENVKFIGEVQTIDLPSLYSSALFTVIPSLWYENLPNALIESFSCGTPVLASNIGSLSSCIKEGYNGFLFCVGDVKDLADKMNYFLKNREELQLMSRHSRLESITKYSPDKHIDKILNVFHRLCE